MAQRLYACLVCGTKHLTETAATNCKHIFIIGKNLLFTNKILDLRNKK